MLVDTIELDPKNNPEEFMLYIIKSVCVMDTTRPKNENWIIPINFDKLDKLIDEL